jgi:hypothetical protein
MTSNQWQGNNLVAGSVMVEHDAIRTLECAYYDFGQFGIFPFQVLSCGNMLEDKLMFAVVSNTAHLVSNASAQNHGPDNKGFDNARNGGGAAGVGGSLTFEQILTLVEAMRQPVVVNAGNNVGNNNGGQGGQGGLVTSQGGPVSPSVPRATPGYTDPEGNVWTPMPKVDLNRTETVPLDRRGADQYSQTTTACGGCNQGALTRADVALLEQQGQVSNDLSLRSLRQQRAQTGLQAGGLVLGAGAFIVGQLEKFGVIKTPFRNGNGGTWNTPGGGPSDMPNGLWQ